MSNAEQIGKNIDALPTEEQKRINEAADEIRNVVKKYGDHGQIALAYVSTIMLEQVTAKTDLPEGVH